jgi:hypothetical protein
VLTARHGVDRNVARTVAPKCASERTGAFAVELAAERQARIGGGRDGHRSPRSTVEFDGDKAPLRVERRDGGHAQARISSPS